ncbi:MAG: tetratricopeptide repeat protein [Chloroflexota bacterium]|nr:tetratricopeptide repeat protein [Chloroflexota bacterium]MDE2961583.1 tetratricopeptide repeat protein [Chloroflexota bacterium]
MSIILQILSLLFVVLWTARLARNKGRNALVWGGVAAIPVVGLLDIFPEWITVLCMLPMLALVFMPTRRPVAPDGGQDGMTACPRCQHAHEAGPTFCTNCGWELTRPYATTDPAAAATETPESANAHGVGHGARVDADEQRAPASDAPSGQPAAEPVMASQQVGESEAAAAQTTSPDSEPAPAFSMAPLSITRPLTAAGMTELGLSLFNQGRVREAVDQFTKAIALDPRYREAWANRARAYTELGLSEKAAADRQQLEAI